VGAVADVSKLNPVFDLGIDGSENSKEGGQHFEHGPPMAGSRGVVPLNPKP
jgi:hypothetical protein